MGATKKKATAPAEPLTIYDVTIDNHRPVTQHDIDTLLARCALHSQTLTDIREAMFAHRRALGFGVNYSEYPLDVPTT